MSNVVKQAKYISTEVGENKNRFWYGFVHTDHSVVTEWGRVGNSSQSKTFEFDSADDAESFLDKKCREKEGKGYRKLAIVEGGTTVTSSNPNLSQVVKDQVKAQDPAVKKLLDRIIAANVHNIVSQTTITYNNKSGVFSTPLGVIDQGAIDLARVKLGFMTDFVKKSDYTSRQFLNLVNDYLMLVPKDVGRKLDPKQLFPDTRSLRTQNDILDSLEASLSLVQGAVVKSAKKVFDVSLKLCDDDAEIDRIRNKYKSTLSKHHECAHLDVKTVYEVNFPTFAARFDKRAKVLGNVDEYWHGTRKANVLSILSKGLIIAPSSAGHVTGRLLGNGIYFANRSTKSLNYAYGSWDGGVRDENAMMFLGQVSMGKAHTVKNPDTEDRDNYPPRGFNSVIGKAGYTKLNYGTTLANDEFVVFDPDQVNLTRLIEFSPGGK